MSESYGKTWDGIEIVPGLTVFTNEMRVGKVLPESRDRLDGWFTVEYRNGGAVTQNAERVATHFEGRSAEAEWLYHHDWKFPGGERTCALCGATEDSDGRCPQAPGSVQDDKIVRKHGEE